MNQKVDIWMPLYIRDYIGATSRLTTEQHGAYLLIIMDYWLNGPPPDDDAVLAHIARLSPEQWSKHRASIERLFTVHNGEWKHGRIEREIDSAEDRRKQAVERGKAGAKARWSANNGQSNGASIEQASSEQSSKDSSSPSPTSTSTQTPTTSKSSDPESNPLSSSQKREPDRSAEVRDVFEYWSEVHDHPRAKLDDKRYKAIRARISDGYEVEDLKQAVDGCKRSPHHQGENDRATVYDDIELICRSAKHVDSFVKFAEGPDLTGMNSAARQTASAAAEWMREGQ